MGSSERVIAARAYGKKGKPRKDNRNMFNAMIWLARSGAPWRDLPERCGPWKSVYTRFRKWLEDGVMNNIFRFLALEAELTELSLDSTIVVPTNIRQALENGRK